MKTETQTRYEEIIKQMRDKVAQTNVSVSDAEKLIALSEKLLQAYEEIRKSRDNWRNKYQIIKNVKMKILKREQAEEMGIDYDSEDNQE